MVASGCPMAVRGRYSPCPAVGDAAGASVVHQPQETHQGRRRGMSCSSRILWQLLPAVVAVLVVVGLEVDRSVAEYHAAASGRVSVTRVGMKQLLLVLLMSHVAR